MSSKFYYSIISLQQNPSYSFYSPQSYYFFLDILHPLSVTALTPNTTFPYYLILVDAFSWFSSIYGLSDKSTLEQYVANPHTCTSGNTFEFFDKEKICTDASSQFNSTDIQDLLLPKTHQPILGCF